MNRREFMAVAAGAAVTVAAAAGVAAGGGVVRVLRPVGGPVPLSRCVLRVPGREWRRAVAAGRPGDVVVGPGWLWEVPPRGRAGV